MLQSQQMILQKNIEFENQKKVNDLQDLEADHEDESVCEDEDEVEEMVE